MGCRNVTEKTQPVGKAAGLGNVAADSSYGGSGGVVCSGNRSHTAGPIKLRKSVVRRVSTLGAGAATSSQLGGSAPVARRGRSGQTSSTDWEGETAGVGEQANTGSEVGGSRMLEDCIEVGGGTEADVPSVHLVGKGRSDHRLGDDTEASPGRPVCRVEMGGDPGRSGGGDSSFGEGAVSVRAANGGDVGTAGGFVAERPGHVPLHRTFCEERGSWRPDASTGGRKVDFSVPGITSSQTHRRRRGSVCYDPPIRIQSGEYCQGYGDLAGDKAAVRVGTQHSLVRRGKRTRLPTTPVEKASPLHVSGVPVMDVAGLRKRLNTESQRRFDEVWKLTFSPEVGKIARSTGRTVFSDVHAGELASFGIARKAVGPGVSSNVPFTVLEEKPEGMRQRFILWTKDANSWLEEKYTAQVPLHHISRYLDQVREECGTTRDFRTGFYAIEIPEEARRLFRFQTEGGSWFELCRLPMGHVCAPEIMHTMAAAAAGDPGYVRPEWQARGVRVDVFIDNIRYTGGAGEVLAATANLDAAAEEFCLTWKPADSNTAEAKYTFLGVDFDHEGAEVKVSLKIKRRLEAVDLGMVTAGQLESMGGRLMHASAVAGETPGRYWFALKFLRRLANNLNAGRRLVGDRVRVPESVAAELRGWMAGATSTRRMHAPFDEREQMFSVFIDASKKGWGGVVVNDTTAEVVVMGDSWDTQESELHINILEGLAFHNTVKQMSPELDGRTVAVWIDNTSVVGVSRKGMSIRSQDLNAAVIGALVELQRRSITFSIRYVRSQLNPADLPSRVDPTTIRTRKHREEVTLAVRAFFTRDVEVARDGACPATGPLHEVPTGRRPATPL